MYNLYNTLFNENQNANIVTPDIALDIINQMHGHNDYENISKYYDITSYNMLISQISDKVNIMHLNSRSLPKNLNRITAFFETLSSLPDVLAVTETWLTNNNKHLFHLHLDNYCSFHLVRQTQATRRSIRIRCE